MHRIDLSEWRHTFGHIRTYRSYGPCFSIKNFFLGIIFPRSWSNLSSKENYLLLYPQLFSTFPHLLTLGLLSFLIYQHINKFITRLLLFMASKTPRKNHLIEGKAVSCSISTAIQFLFKKLAVSLKILPTPQNCLSAAN